MVEAGYGLGGSLRRHPPRPRRARCDPSPRLLRRRLHDEPPARARHRRQGLGRVRLRRAAARARARRPRTAARPPPVLLEKREVGARLHTPRRGRARVLGVQRLPLARRSVAGTAVLGRLTWLTAEVAGTMAETPRVRTLRLETNGWPGHRAGQHLDVRLTAEDGYQAERSYSIATAPDGELAITV